VDSIKGAKILRERLAEAEGVVREAECDRADGDRADVSSSEVVERIRRWTGEESPVDADEAADARRLRG
jgi:hypothetical protein